MGSLAQLGKISALLLASLASRKLWMTLFALMVNYGLYWGSVRCIYTFTDAALGAAQLQVFLAITQAAFWTNTTILLAFLGIHGATSWANNTSSVLSSLVSNAQTRRDENINIKEERVEKVTHEYAEKYRDDESYRPIEPDTTEVFR